MKQIRSKGEAALVAGGVFPGAGVAISSLVLGVWNNGAMLWAAMDESHAGPSWFALILIPLVPPLGLFAAAFLTSGALAVGAVLAAAAAALLRRVPFWFLLTMAAPCLVASHIQFTCAINLKHWGEPSSPGYPPLVVLLPLFGSWLLLRRVLQPRTVPARAGNQEAGDA